MNEPDQDEHEEAFRQDPFENDLGTTLSAAEQEEPSDAAPPLSQKELIPLLKKHQKWLESNGQEGEKLNLESANLQEVDLTGANLQKADLRRANLQKVDLAGANLQEAELSFANLKGAYLLETNLQEAFCFRANLQEAILEQD